MPTRVFPIQRFSGDIPTSTDPGGFGFARKNHRHEGVDLYAPPETEVLTISAGLVVSTYMFTGPDVGMPWWNTTYATAVADETGIWVYGETSIPRVTVGQFVSTGEVIGVLTPVLKADKGRPMTMLHIERWKLHTAPHTFLWQLGDPQPSFIEDPTKPLLSLLQQSRITVHP